jgi:hypothetical protein
MDILPLDGRTTSGSEVMFHNRWLMSRGVSSEKRSAPERHGVSKKNPAQERDRKYKKPRGRPAGLLHEDFVKRKRFSGASS